MRSDYTEQRSRIAALVGLGALSATALMLSDLPLPAAIALAACCLGRGLQLPLREHRRGTCTLERTADGSGWRRLDPDGRTVALQDVRWHLRGPIAVMLAREADGRRCQFAWAPDTLCASRRRQLRLAGLVSSRSDKPLPAVAA